MNALSWLTNLFTNKKRNKHTFLTKEEVKKMEKTIAYGSYSIEFLQSQYGVSKTTIHKVVKGTHRFSRKD